MLRRQSAYDIHHDIQSVLEIDFIDQPVTSTGRHQLRFNFCCAASALVLHKNLQQFIGEQYIELSSIRLGVPYRDKI